MPALRPVERLEHMSYMVLSCNIHKLAVEVEETPDVSSLSMEELIQCVECLPAMIIEQLIIKVIETIHVTISRYRRTIGLSACLTILLRPILQRLDLSGLFFRMRLPGSINDTIRNVVNTQVASMRNLTSLNMVSKCSDCILTTISKHCPEVTDVNISLSDLVTDEGLKTLAKGCQKLETLGIYKCWEVTSKGIAFVLQKSNNLYKMKCDQVGAVIITAFKNSGKTFKLTHFEQTQNLFEPLEEDMVWVGQACPNLETVSLFVDDEGLGMVSKLGSIKVLEVETTAVLGRGFVSAISSLGSSLQTLQLNCNQVTHDKLMLLGSCCPLLSVLHISTTAVKDDKILTNPGHLFSALTTLHLQVWKEAVITKECLEFFLLWCHQLESLLLKADVEFFTDSYLGHILSTNPLTNAKHIYIASDNYVPLTITSVHRLMSTCPGLESLAVSSWDVTEEDYLKLRTDVAASNYNLAVT